jgi:hypothetical protein
VARAPCGSSPSSWTGTETRIDAVDLDKGERRQFRLDRIAHAEVLRLQGDAP